MNNPSDTASDKIYNYIDDLLKDPNKDTLIRVARELENWEGGTWYDCISFFERPLRFKGKYFDLLWNRYNSNLERMLEDDALNDII